MLHRYEVWHHLRRLRGRLGTGHATRLQIANVCSHITAAVNFLDWLAGWQRSDPRHLHPV